ncbi:MAG: DUF4351 domain-containing protein [Cyanobacteriota bacterium]|nr:DUF4351 domain-containing protein [Cyanobacteriota bacterium]
MPDLEMIPEPMQVVPELNKAMNIANRANLSLEELENLEKREMFFFDRVGAVRKGIEEGRKQGLEQGLERGQRQLILRLLNRQFGELSGEVCSQIDRLSTPQLEMLGETLFEFNKI